MRILGTALLGGVALLLAACGGSNDAPQQSAAAEPPPAQQQAQQQQQPDQAETAQAQAEQPAQAAEQQAAPPQTSSQEGPPQAEQSEQDAPPNDQQSDAPLLTYLPRDATHTDEGIEIIRDNYVPSDIGRYFATLWGIRIIDLDELGVGAPRDAIPAIFSPTYLSIEEASELYEAADPAGAGAAGRRRARLPARHPDLA